MSEAKSSEFKKVQQSVPQQQKADVSAVDDADFEDVRLQEEEK